MYYLIPSLGSVAVKRPVLQTCIERSTAALFQMQPSPEDI